MPFYIGMNRREISIYILPPCFFYTCMYFPGKHVPYDLEIFSKNYHLQKMIAFDDR